MAAANASEIERSLKGGLDAELNMNTCETWKLEKLEKPESPGPSGD